MLIKAFKKIIFLFILSTVLVMSSCLDGQKTDIDGKTEDHVVEEKTSSSETSTEENNNNTKFEPVDLPNPNYSSESSINGNNLENSFVEIFELANKFTVTIHALSRDGSMSLGSGVIYSHNKDTNEYFILTNHHVIEEMDDFFIETTIDKIKIKATLLGSVKTNDVAILKFVSESVYPVVKFESDEVKKGQYCFAIGTPISTEYQNNSTIGNVSLVLDDKVVHTASINSGNSGGPLLNSKGNLIGLNNAKLTGSTSTGAVIENMFFAINLKSIKESLELISLGKNDIENSENKIEKVLLGITVVNVSSIKELSKYPSYFAVIADGIECSQEEFNNFKEYSLKIPENVNEGVFIISVDENGNSFNVLQPNDVLISINEIPTYTTYYVSFILEDIQKGDILNIKVYRSGNLTNGVINIKN